MSLDHNTSEAAQDQDFPSQPVGDQSGYIKPASMSNLMLYGTLAFIALLIGWATLTQLDRTVYATGRVVPTAQLQLISNLEGGVVSAILTRAGETVREGEPLIQLDPTASESDFAVGVTSIASLSARIERLRAEITGQRPNFSSARSPAEAQQIEIEQALYRSRQANLSSMQSAANSRITQAERGVAEARANYDAAVAGRDGARQQVAILRPLVASGVEPRLTLIQAERQADMAASQAVAAQASIARASSAVAEAHAAAAQIRQDWQAQAAAELAASQAEAAGRKEAQPALANRLERTIVRAPMTGRVNRVLVNTVGGTARPGEPLVEIVPSRSGLTVEARVLPRDIAFVRIGQRSLIKITSYNYSIYGGLEGKVINISPDSIVDEQSGETYYTVKIGTPENFLLSPGGQRLPIGPGMLADVNLIGDKRSVLSYLLTPFTRLSENAFRE